MSVNDPVEADLVIVIALADAPPPDDEDDVPADPGTPGDPGAPGDWDASDQVEATADLPSTGMAAGGPIGLAALSVLAGLALVLLGSRARTARERRLHH